MLTITVAFPVTLNILETVKYVLQNTYDVGTVKKFVLLTQFRFILWN